MDQVDKHKKCLTVFLDLKKAFDTVSIPILVHKLEKIGIRGIPLSLFKSYLEGRQQQVKIDQYISENVNISYGVPQGSVLGPTLFLVYINGLCNMSVSKGHIFSYADDTAVVFAGTSWSEVRKHTETGLAKIRQWLNSNLLTLNTSKTNFICFTPNIRTQPGIDFTIKIHECSAHHSSNDSPCICPQIYKVPHTKYLGVILDERLSWHLHLELIIGRIRKLVWIFKKLRHVVTKKVLTQIYISLAQSVIVYCIPVWGGATKTKFLEIERAQRMLLKVMYFKRKRYPTAELYAVSDLLTVRKLYIIQTVLKLHKALVYYPNPPSRRRKYVAATIPIVNTAFAARQYNKQSSLLYNLANDNLNIYPLNYHVCKKAITDWLKPKNYDEIEVLLQRDN